MEEDNAKLEAEIIKRKQILNVKNINAISALKRVYDSKKGLPKKMMAGLESLFEDSKKNKGEKILFYDHTMGPSPYILASQIHNKQIVIPVEFDETLIKDSTHGVKYVPANDIFKIGGDIYNTIYIPMGQGLPNSFGEEMNAGFSSILKTEGYILRLGSGLRSTKKFSVEIGKLDKNTDFIEPIGIKLLSYFV